jgi:hypothetical protein
MPGDGRITVVIPSVPPRADKLRRALESVTQQTHPVHAVSIAVDHDREGAGPTRTRAMMAVDTEWLAFLDDDDEMRPFHLEYLMRAQAETGADVVIPWFEVYGGGDPFPMHRGRQFDVRDPHIFPITVLVRTELAQVGSFPKPDPQRADWSGDDFPFWLQMARAGATFHSIPDQTWVWHHWGGNLSGLPQW